ncbi:unnamed protein product [Symbiodinium sp. CCMP2592]|nr:unnamed protein product [Symbiodinium sp. CCMP2592]
MSAHPSSSGMVLQGVVAHVANPGGLTPWQQSSSAANPGGLTPGSGVLALVRVEVTDVPGYGTLTLGADSNWTLDDVKRVLGRVVNIPLGDWGFHALTRCTPHNMPVSHLRPEDMPLRFCWHEWSESFRHSQQR